MMNGATQQTLSFTPIQTVDGTQTTAITPAAPSATPQYVPMEAQAPQPTYGYLPHEESARGAVLGWLAATLMLIIVAAFVWSTLISDATRDRITGIF